jgi:RNA polymerase sigma-54 factor
MLKPTLQLKLGQTLTMTPQLQQAIRLLQLPVLDLSAQIQDALEENIMLEMEDLPDVPETNGESTAEIETIRAEDSWQSRSEQIVQDGGWNGEGRPVAEFADESGQTLREHLLWQLEIEGALHVQARRTASRLQRQHAQPRGRLEHEMERVVRG